jgi:hypothetical protein
MRRKPGGASRLGSLLWLQWQVSRGAGGLGLPRQSCSSGSRPSCHSPLVSAQFLSRCRVKGSPWLRTALVEAAQAARLIKETYQSAQYYRLMAWWGKNKAAVAVGHTILVIVYHMKDDGTYHEWSRQYFGQRAH